MRNSPLPRSPRGATGRARWTRYDPSEAARLYSGYRGERYFHVRHRHEPWYTRTFNDALAVGGGVEARRREVAGWMRRYGDAGRIDTVLDYGGDHGQFLPDDVGRERYVYDISGVEPVPGVTAFSTEAELVGRTFDAIVVSQVLEHIPDVGRLLDHVRSLASPNGALLYIEVPDEHFDLRFMGRSARYQAYVDRVLAVPPLARLLDFYSAAFRVKFGVIPPLGFPRVHEHINYFDGRSLRAALTARSFEVVSCERLTTTSGRVWLAVARSPS